MSNLYKKVRRNGKMEQLHRMVWMDANGPVPKGMVVDHKDRDIHNNELSNLRVITRTENNINSASNIGKYMQGVFKPVSSKGYCAQIRARGKKLYLGTFESELAAHRAYLNAKDKFYPGIYI